MSRLLVRWHADWRVPCRSLCGTVERAPEAMMHEVFRACLRQQAASVCHQAIRPPAIQWAALVPWSRAEETEEAATT